MVHVKIISVLESVSSVLATETVIQLLENVSVSLGGTVKTAVLQTALVILIATIVVIAVLTQHILLAEAHLLPQTQFPLSIGTWFPLQTLLQDSPIHPVSQLVHLGLAKETLQ
jgi:hypothetical protein